MKWQYIIFIYIQAAIGIKHSGFFGHNFVIIMIIFIPLNDMMCLKFISYLF